jgi:hypothetical protein
MLLRFEGRRAFRISAYIIIAVQVCFMISNVLYPFLQCNPTSAAWDVSLPRSACLPDESLRIASNVSSAVNITTDILLSLAPLSFLMQLRRTSAEKILLVLLFAFGLVVSAVSIVKAVVVNAWGHTDDFLVTSFEINLYSVIEEMLAVLATCAPWLKGPIQAVLEPLGFRFGFTSTHPQALGSVSTPATSGDDTAISQSHEEKSDRGNSQVNFSKSERWNTSEPSVSGNIRDSV